MNATELPLRPDVAAFVAQVSGLLADLPEEDRLELIEGLEADLGDQVAEQGAEVLADPEAYARELRVAAGFEPVAPRRARGLAEVPLGARLDQVKAWWVSQMARPPIASVWQLLVVVRPLWWAIRGWVAALLISAVVFDWDQPGVSWMPGGHPGLGLLLLGGCVLGSVLVGVGKVWPGPRAGSPDRVAARVALLGLNIFALAMLPVAASRLDGGSWLRFNDGWNQGYWQAMDNQRTLGLVNRGEQVCNLAAYDAAGEPLVGVQLFDQDGRPLDTQCPNQLRRRVPWMLGDVPRWNVFPLGDRATPARTPAERESVDGATFPGFERATTPAVTNPLLPDPPKKANQGKSNKGKSNQSKSNQDRSTQGEKNQTRSATGGRSGE